MKVEQGGNITIAWRREIEEADPFWLIDQAGSNRTGNES